MVVACRSGVRNETCADDPPASFLLVLLFPSRLSIASSRLISCFPKRAGLGRSQKTKNRRGEGRVFYFVV